jgi:hypothetical protein
MTNYDSFSSTYNLTSDLQRSPNKKWKRIFAGPAPWLPSDIGLQGVRNLGTFYSYPYQQTYTGTLTVSTLTLTNKLLKSDFDVTFSMRTVKMLKTTNHKNWEVAWFFWHFNENGYPYSDKQAFRHYYYILLKDNGHIEIGKKDNVIDEQRFLTGTGSQEPTFTWSLGQWYKIRLRQTVNHIEMWLDDVLKFDKNDDGTLTDVKGTIPAMSTSISSGKFGLYAEDAEAEFTPLVIV